MSLWGTRRGYDAAGQPIVGPGDPGYGKGPKMPPTYVYGRTHPDAVADQTELAAELDTAAGWTADWWWAQELADWIDAADTHTPTVTPIDGTTTASGRQAFRVDCGCGVILDLRSRYAGDAGTPVDEVGAWRLHHQHVFRTVVHPAFQDRLETFHAERHCRPPCCDRPTEESTP